jgi:diguanylate cyclase (GGDEF)-like protein/PAS domain S-box-containing protein
MTSASRVPNLARSDQQESPSRLSELRALLDDTTELICAANAEGRITFANKAWLDTLGYALSEAVGMQAIDLVVPDDRPRFVEAGRRLHAGEAVDEFEAVLMASDGRRVVCRGRARPEMVDDLSAPGGRRCLRTHAAYRDVTAERRAEADRARLVALIESTSDFVATARADGTIEYLNRAGRRLLGIADGADARALNARDFHPAETVERLTTEAYPAALRDGRWTGDAQLRIAPNETIPVSMALVAHPSLVSGEPPYFTAVMRDVRERHEAEKALRESEARTRGAIEASLDAVFILRAVRGEDGSISDLKVADCNSQALLLARTRRKYIIDRSASAVFREARKRGLLDVCARVIETGNPFTAEYRLDRTESAYTWAWLQIVRVGEGVAITARDISAQKASEDSLRALALVDDLTGVANRRGFLAAAEREAQRAIREHRSALLAYIDVDDFKQINDSHGHAEGDEALRSIGKVLRAVFRGADVIGRLGGDEFAVLVLPTNYEVTDGNHDLLAHIENGIRERIRYQLSKVNAAATAAGRPYEISLSVGIAAVRDLSGESMSPSASLEALMAEADECLYEAKRARRQTAA